MNLITKATLLACTLSVVDSSGTLTLTMESVKDITCDGEPIVRWDSPLPLNVTAEGNTFTFSQLPKYSTGEVAAAFNYPRYNGLFSTAGNVSSNSVDSLAAFVEYPKGCSFQFDDASRLVFPALKIAYGIDYENNKGKWYMAWNNTPAASLDSTHTNCTASAIDLTCEQKDNKFGHFIYIATSNFSWSDKEILN
uniref:Uncharacterized protein n=1 Tax=Mucochytrium quahogii TaxID=96639 RepID=A0A7S2WT00_9STRA|mmetsp:Transcript_5514/g.9823  ORF Transcript_5514/g.9823 Transcript_5514/m.9823 type:complete len:194 (+) Transcript_5514:1201-1782(+)